MKLKCQLIFFSILLTLSCSNKNLSEEEYFKWFNENKNLFERSTRQENITIKCLYRTKEIRQIHHKKSRTFQSVNNDSYLFNIVIKGHNVDLRNDYESYFRFQFINNIKFKINDSVVVSPSIYHSENILAISNEARISIGFEYTDLVNSINININSEELSINDISYFFDLTNYPTIITT